jgi:hypothetical protein
MILCKVSPNLNTFTFNYDRGFKLRPKRKNYKYKFQSVLYEFNFVFPFLLVGIIRTNPVCFVSINVPELT